jgi:hypothetical protein
VESVLIVSPNFYMDEFNVDQFKHRVGSKSGRGLFSTARTRLVPSAELGRVGSCLHV